MRIENRFATFFGCLVASLTPGAASGEGTNQALITVRARALTEITTTLLPASLDREPLLLINSQGGPAGQNDLSVRGSSFSGAGLSLAGLALRNPQTEHFNLEMPLPVFLLTNPELLTGIDQVRVGDSHPVATLGLDFRPIVSCSRFQVGLGEHSRNWQDFLWQRPLGEQSGSGIRSGLSLFGYRDEDYALNYSDNNLRRLGGGAHLQFGDGLWRTDLAVGSQRKRFGARGYYGASPAWPAEEEITDTLAIFSTVNGRLDAPYTRVSLLWRSIRDEYWLTVSSPTLYENCHRSSTLAAWGDGRWPVVGNWNLLRRVGPEDETIRSNRLGNHWRRRGSLLLLPEWSNKPLRVCSGLRAEIFSHDEPALLPQAGLEYDPTGHLTVYAAYTTAVRQPSYTELNYDSPGSLGNQGLRRQEVSNAETGVRGVACGFFSWKASALVSLSKHTVDWVRLEPAATRWEAVDLGRVETRGLELTVGCSGESLSLVTGYTLLSKTSETSPYASRYVLDFPEQLLKLTVNARLFPGCRAAATQTFRWQHRSPARSGDRLGVPASFSLHFSPSFWDHAEVTLFADNVWNDDFESLPGCPPAERRLALALTFSW
ncbi:MAG: TonB-dependent receptor [Kiritimatiellae bacterium]|nr:TonB-dependent receptor [Kiritimatiellia bacterium]